MVVKYFEFGCLNLRVFGVLSLWKCNAFSFKLDDRRFNCYLELFGHGVDLDVWFKYGFNR